MNPDDDGLVADRDLDVHLARWADQVRLDAAERDTLFATVVGVSEEVAAEPAALPADWWSNLTARVTATVVAAGTRGRGDWVSATA